MVQILTNCGFSFSSDIFPYNLTAATESLKHVLPMPLFGLNVYSMLKYHTLVLTTSAVERLEERLLFQLNRSDARKMTDKFKLDQ